MTFSTLPLGLLAAFSLFGCVFASIYISTQIFRANNVPAARVLVDTYDVSRTVTPLCLNSWARSLRHAVDHVGGWRHSLALKCSSQRLGSIVVHLNNRLESLRRLITPSLRCGAPSPSPGRVFRNTCCQCMLQHTQLQLKIIRTLQLADEISACSWQGFTLNRGLVPSFGRVHCTPAHKHMRQPVIRRVGVANIPST